MNEFRVFALGDMFDPDAYLVSAPLKFDGLWRKGESGRGHPKSSGVFKTLGDGLTIPLLEQERIAIEYLSENREALKALARHPQVSHFSLGLQYYLQTNVVGFCMGPTARLMQLCVDIGILPTYYVTLDTQILRDRSGRGIGRCT